MKYIMTIFIYLLLTSCFQQNQPKQNIYSTEELFGNQAELQKFTYEGVAIDTISIIMNQPVKSISSHRDKDIYVVTYNRKSDGQEFVYKVMFNSNIVTWATIDGRWRNTKYDEQIKYEETGNVLKMNIVYSDGSQQTVEFKK